MSAAGQDLGTSAAETASTTDYRSLTASGGQVDLQQIAALQGPVARSAATVEDALAAVDAVNSPWLVPLVTDELDRFRAELSDVGEQTRLAAEGLRVAPTLLGADGAKRYFLTLATPGESRNAGGYAGAFGVLRTDQGRLELELTGKSADLNPRIGDPYQLVYPPDWEQRYQRYHVDLFSGNLTASPDWPTDADLIRQVYREATGTEVAGAVYVDPEALAALLRLTGPVDVAGLDEPVTADNVVQFLLTDQYVQFRGDNATRRDMLGDVAEAVFHALTSKPLPGISAIADTLGPAVEAGHLRVTVYDPDSEAFLDDLGMTGRFTTPPGVDHLALVSANQLPNKIDVFLHRSWNVVVTHDAGTGEVRSTVTVTLRNDAPASGLPPYILGDGKVLPPGTNLDLLGLYSPLDPHLGEPRRAAGRIGEPDRTGEQRLLRVGAARPRADPHGHLRAGRNHRARSLPPRRAPPAPRHHRRRHGRPQRRPSAVRGTADLTPRAGRRQHGVKLVPRGDDHRHVEEWLQYLIDCCHGREQPS